MFLEKDGLGGDEGDESDHAMATAMSDKPGAKPPTSEAFPGESTAITTASRTLTTTQLYDRRDDQPALEEFEKIQI